MQPPEAILLLGPTGAGKTPLGDWLERCGLGGRRCWHFDFGANLRAAAENAAAVTPDLTAADLAIVRRSLATGALLENQDFQIAVKILRAFTVRRGVGADDLFVLNGLPRHAGQAQEVDRLATMRLVVYLECSPAVVVARLRHDAGGDRAGRNDDTPAQVVRKLEVFRERTLPLCAYYRERGVPVLNLTVALDTTPATLARQIPPPR